MRVLVSLGFLGATAVSMAQLFDWETASIGTFPSVSQTIGGITATATAEGSGNVDVANIGALSGFGSFGARSLLANGGTSANRPPLRISFSTLVDAVSVEFGDGGNDDDQVVRVSAYSDTDVMVDQDLFSYGLLSGMRNLALDGGGISYVVIETTGTAFPNSIYVDNVRVTPVPEPATVAALGLGTLALLRRRRGAKAARD